MHGRVLAQATPPPPDKVDRLLELLADPDVKAGLPRKATSGDAAAGRAGGGESAMAPAGISSALDMIREHTSGRWRMRCHAAAQFARAWTILELEFEE